MFVVLVTVLLESTKINGTLVANETIEEICVVDPNISTSPDLLFYQVSDT